MTSDFCYKAFRDQGCEHQIPGGDHEGVDQDGVQERQVQPQLVLPREGGHKGYGPWRWLQIIGETAEKKVQETQVLNRIIRVDHEGCHHDADQRHGELIVKALKMQEAKSVQTPGEDGKSWQEE